MINKPLLEKVLGLVELAAAHRASYSWYQGSWRQPIETEGGHPSCGTAMCFAGWTPIALNRSYVSEVPFEPGFQDIVITEGDALPRGIIRKYDGSFELDDTGHYIRTPLSVGDHVHVSNWAQAQLGLDDDQADRLFASYNRLDELREIVAEFVELED